jgi:aspartyl aminopeptidase
MGLTPADMGRKLASSFLVSCDNAHAVHPNHPEYKDGNHAVYMNGGVVVKYNANQRYTTDGVSAAIFGLICERAGVPIQRYANRADMPGGSTLGNIANTQVSLNTIDIGLPQLAMHSAYETAGARDTEMMVKALTKFFGSAILAESNGSYTVV